MPGDKSTMYIAVKCRWDEPESRMLTLHYHDSLSVLYEWILSWCRGGEIYAQKSEVPADAPVYHIWTSGDEDEDAKDRCEQPEAALDDEIERWVDGKLEWTITVHAASLAVFEPPPDA
jgi:hypothetical protein